MTIDYEKCFGTLDKKILLKKLDGVEINHEALKWFEKYVQKWKII